MIFDVLEENEGLKIRKLLYTEKLFLKMRNRVETKKFATLFLTLTSPADTIQNCVQNFFVKENVPGNRVRARQNVLRTPLPPFVFVELGFRKKCDYESITMTILKAMDLSIEDLSQTKYVFLRNVF